MKVINELPNATKKGLRMVITDVDVNDDGEIIGAVIEYSDYQQRGFTRVEIPRIKVWSGGDGERG